jgi:hypothetical protein
MPYNYTEEVELSFLNGLTIKSITGLFKDSDKVDINTECGKKFIFYHDQEFFESVSLYDFDFDFDLRGALILSSEEVCSKETPEDVILDDLEDSETWTFYKIETTKGGLWMRWFGVSSGHYSESVSLVWANKPDN